MFSEKVVWVTVRGEACMLVLEGAREVWSCETVTLSENTAPALYTLTGVLTQLSGDLESSRSCLPLQHPDSSDCPSRRGSEREAPQRQATWQLGGLNSPG